MNTTVEEHAVRKHSKFSPSSLEHREQCASFEPSDFDSADANEGTMLHEAAELEDLTLCDTKEQAESVQNCLDYVENIKSEYPGDVVHEKEVRVQVYGDVTSGIVDVLLSDGDRADVIDYKFGRNEVTPAFENIQLGAYAVGALNKYPNLTEATVHIVSPRRNAVSVHTYTREALNKVTERIEAVVRSCQDPNKQETPHFAACFRCGRKTECNAMQGILMTTGNEVLKSQGFELPSTFAFDKLATPQDRAKAQSLAAILEDWCKQIKDLNRKAAVEDGIEIPGYSLRSRSGSTTIAEPKLAAVRVAEKFGIPVELLFEASNLKLPALVDLIHGHIQTNQQENKPNKKDLRAIIEEDIEELLNVGSSVTYLQKDRGIDHETILIQGQ